VFTLHVTIILNDERNGSDTRIMHYMQIASKSGRYNFPVSLICELLRLPTKIWQFSCQWNESLCKRAYPKVSGLSHNEINNNKHSLRSNTKGIQKVMAGKLIILTHKIAIQLHLVTESCTICSFRSRMPVRKLLDTPSYIPLLSGHNFHVKTLYEPMSSTLKFDSTLF
jgi:hypothetical protein